MKYVSWKSYKETNLVTSKNISMLPISETVRNWSKLPSFFGRESDKYRDNSKESIWRMVNKSDYHRNNTLKNYTYNSLTGCYY